MPAPHFYALNTERKDILCKVEFSASRKSTWEMELVSFLRHSRVKRTNLISVVQSQTISFAFCASQRCDKRMCKFRFLLVSWLMPEFYFYYLFREHKKTRKADLDVMATTPLPLSKLQLERIRPIREIVRPRSLSQCCAVEEMDESERMAMLPLHTGDCRKEGRCGRLKGRDGLVLFLWVCMFLVGLRRLRGIDADELADERSGRSLPSLWVWLWYLRLCVGARWTMRPWEKRCFIRVWGVCRDDLDWKTTREIEWEFVRRWKSDGHILHCTFAFGGLFTTKTGIMGVQLQTRHGNGHGMGGILSWSWGL